MWKKQKRNNKIDNKFYMKMQYILLKKEERILKMTLKPVQDFFDSENKYRYFYNAVNAITIFLLVFVIINQYHSFIEQKTVESYLLLAQIASKVCIGGLVIVILLRGMFKPLLYKADKNNTKIILFTIKDLLDIITKLFVIIELASMLIVSLSNVTIIFYILVGLYYFCLLIKGLYHFNRDIFTFPDIALPYFDCNNNRLYLNDNVIYHNHLHTIRKEQDTSDKKDSLDRNETYYLYKCLYGGTNIKSILLEEALKDKDGRLTFYCHDYEN